ncbi:unnamed protein product [Schistosoma margrebowiei]|uniref:Uncharacterized protein n=1 Tax=Schistosoma margrebowiei TaxID=48269 RepID=A0A183MR77_9TREM|nr:unnamed protein product [Schistosoma margrebowiei]
MQLDDSNFADDQAFLFHTHKQMQVKKNSMASTSASVGLNIHNRNINIIKYNTENTNTITLDGETLEQVGVTRTWLISIIDRRGGSDSDVKARIDNTRTTLLQLTNIRIQNTCQPISKAESSKRTSKQFCCIELKPRNYYNHHQNNAGIHKQFST